jgi:hypothetical protein
MRVRSPLRWFAFSVGVSMLAACGSSADISDNSGDDSGVGDDTSSAGDSRVTTDSRTDTTTTGDSAKDGNTGDTTTSKDTGGGSDTTTGDDTRTGDDTAVADTTPDITPTDVVIDVPVVDVIGGDVSCSGIECAGFPTSFVTGCTFDDNCVGEMHEVDCCGAMHVIGMNHSESTKFCAAEYGGTAAAGCRTEYPSPSGCSSDVITADDGATTTDPTKVAVHCVLSSTSSGTCKTFVCGTTGGTPCPTSRRIGTCGP